MRVAIVSHSTKATKKDIEYLLTTMGIWREAVLAGASIVRICGADDSETASAISHLSANNFTAIPLGARPKSPVILRSLDGLASSLRNHQPQVVHIVGEPWQRGSISAVRIAKQMGAKVGIHFAENGPALVGPKGRLRSWLGHLALQLVDYCVVWSTGSAAVARSLGFSGPVRILPSVGVPNNFFKGERADWNTGRRRIIFAGRLAEEKGVQDILQVASRLKADAIDCYIAGDGPLRTMVEAAERRNIVSYLGRLERTAIPKELRRSGLTLVPSRPGTFRGRLGIRTRCEEQFGLVIVESMAVGTPVLAYRTGATEEVVGPGGELVAVGDVEGMVAMARKLLADPHDWEMLSGAARKWAQRFSEAHIARELNLLWNDLGWKRASSFS